MSVTAPITNITRASLHDGPGVRSVVYLQGCGLTCAWCHNPETLGAEAQLMYAPSKCIHCGACVRLCPDCHRIEGDDLVLMRDGCRRCGRCVEGCPTGALSQTSREMTAEEVIAELEKDLPYYRQSGGGITLSGGECLLRPNFCIEVLRHFRSLGIHTAIETALFVPWEHVEAVAAWCDLIFADCKLADPDRHRRYTGQDNRRILNNLEKLTALHPQKVTVRIPLIPTVNDRDEDIAAFAAVLSPLAERLGGVEVLKYNDLASSKYDQCGKAYTKFGKPQSDETMHAYCAALEQALKHKTTVFTAV